MDFVSESVAAIAHVSSATGINGMRILECLLGMVVAAAVLRLEVTRRAPDLALRNVGRTDGSYALRCKSLLLKYAPEAAGLMGCLFLAVAMRVHGSKTAAVDEKAWAEIMRQWPILLTADSLLALQAMLRLTVLISTVLRAGGDPTPLSQEAAAIQGGAALGRVVLAARSEIYMLDGPLGGRMPLACEVASLVLLAVHSRRMCRRALATSASTLFVVAWVASRNRLALANDKFTDGLFIFAHLAELIASFAYLFRALLMDVGTGRCGVALRFTHIVMPVQQCLAAYYFVQAFEYMPELVAAGHPFHVLHFGNVAQLGAYAGAAVLHWAEYFESPSVVVNAVQEEGEVAGSSLMPDASPQSARSAPRYAAVNAVL